MATYEVIIKDPATGTIWEVIPKSYNFTEKLNLEPTASFTFSFEELKKMAERNGTTVLAIFTSALREIYINRNGAKIFYGIITDFEVAPGGVGEKNLSVKAMGFFGLFKKRLVGIGVEEVFSATDAGEIAWTLIDNSQLDDAPYSDWGITEGSITASKNRDRRYLFDNVYESIVRLSNNNLADGFDFEIDNTKAFNVYYPTRGQDRPTITFDERTAASWKYKKQLILNMANIVYAVGEGFNEDVQFETRTASTALRTPFGTLEEKLEARDVSEAATLQDKGDARLAEGSSPPVELDSLSHYDDAIAYSDYNLGDTIRANYPDLAINDETYRVVERTFTMATPQSIGLVSNKVK
jgi:hypothetical protein